MDVKEAVEGARDAMTVKRVFGEPYERDGVTIIPAAAVRGGAGGGSGEGTGPQGEGGRGGGSGFGLSARPVGAYVLREGAWEWQPAVDVTRVILGAQLVVVVAWLVLRSISRARARARIKTAKVKT
jgi:uncharacterized spore protein YtfJ